MISIFVSFGGQNYARYLTYVSTFLANIDASHPRANDLIKRGAFSVARSFITGNRCDTNKTMEETCGMPSDTEVRAAVMRELLEFSPTVVCCSDIVTLQSR